MVLFINLHLSGAEPSSLNSVTDVAKNLEATLFWDPLSGTVVLSKNGHLVNFRAGEELVLFDYADFALLDAPLRSSRGVFLSDTFVARLESFFDTKQPEVHYRVGAILIDPGHGGKDPGAIGKAIVGGKTIEIREKDIALTVSKDLHARLTKKYPDKKIIMTRTEDTYPTLEERVEIANSLKLNDHEAILYVSVHANAAFNKKSSGFEVWHLSPDYRRTVINSDDSAESREILPILNSMMEENYDRKYFDSKKYYGWSCRTNRGPK